MAGEAKKITAPQTYEEGVFLGLLRLVEPDEREAVIRDLERISSPVAATETGVRPDA